MNKMKNLNNKIKNFYECKIFLKSSEFSLLYNKLYKTNP